MDKSFEARLSGLLLVAAVPPAIGLIGVMIYADISVYLTSLVALTLLMVIGYCTSTLYQRVNYQFRTLSNLLEGMTLGEFSLRGRRRNEAHALGELVNQINLLADTLAEQRLQVKEHQLLLTKVISQIEVGIIAIDPGQRISLINPAAAELLGGEVTALQGQGIADFQLPALPNPGQPTLVEWQFPHRLGKFQIYVDQFIEQGLQHRLLFITDVRDLLRSEERKTWQNLVRVLSHEINNSLTPIAALSQMLNGLVGKSAPGESREELQEGLGIIAERAASLRQFIDRYRQLAKLPEPQPAPVDVAALLAKIGGLFEHRAIVFDGESGLTARFDPVQIEQLLINLVKNADEAMTDPTAQLRIAWRLNHQTLQIRIIDQGTGLSNPGNLFVPFYTTKAGGNGIGLVLCRQIAEGHGGYLRLQNRDDGKGCEAVVELPTGA